VNNGPNAESYSNTRHVEDAASVPDRCGEACVYHRADASNLSNNSKIETDWSWSHSHGEVLTRRPSEVIYKEGYIDRLGSAERDPTEGELTCDAMIGITWCPDAVCAATVTP
jgi:hypothetical protein